MAITTSNYGMQLPNATPVGAGGLAIYNNIIELASHRRTTTPSVVRNMGARILVTEDFAAASDWTNAEVGGDGSIEDEATYFRAGSQGVKFGIPVGQVSSRNYYHWSANGSGVNINSGSVARIRYWVPDGAAKPDAIWFALCSDADVTHKQPKTLAYSVDDPNYGPGWHVVEILYDPAYSSNNFDGTDVTGLYVWVGDSAGKYIIVDQLTLLTHDSHKPTFVWWSDDCNDDCMALCAYWEKYHWYATLGVIASKVGDAGKCTLAQLKELQSRGHLIVNHTWSHLNWDNLTVEEIKEEINRGRYWMETNGFLAGADILVVPYDFGCPVGAAQEVMNWIIDNNRCVRISATRSIEATQRETPYEWSHGSPVLPTDGRLVWTSKNDSGITETWINNTAMTYRGHLNLLVHTLDAGSLTTAEFQARVDLVRTKEVAGTAYVKSLEEYLAYIATV